MSFFAGKPVTIIPKHDLDVVLVKIGDDDERPIFELGDGIQQCVILVAPLFFYSSSERSDGLTIFVEEPDMFLHPGYQRLWLDAMLTWADYPLQVFATTHSNHLLERTIDSVDLGVFRVGSSAAGGDKSFDVVSFRDKSLLEYIGVGFSSVFLSSCTIWVEGPTDRAYFRAYLDRVMSVAEKSRYKEDLHYSFVEYGGSNVAHMFRDVRDGGYNPDAFCATCMVIVDCDDENGKRERKEYLRKLLESRFVVLKVREVENLLSPFVVGEVVRHYERDMALELNIVSEREWGEAHMGDLIEKRLLPRKSVRRAKYAARSGTLMHKTPFCEKAVEIIRRQDLPTEKVVSKSAHRVARSILDFIRSKNA